MNLSRNSKGVLNSLQILNITTMAKEKKDTFIDEITAMSAAPVQNKDVSVHGFDMVEPEGEILVSGSTFWDWYKDGQPHIGKVFVGAYLGERENPSETFDNIVYDFMGADGNPYLMGDNYAITDALNQEIGGVKVKDLKPPPILWIKLLAVEQSAKGKFNRFKVKLVKQPAQ